MAKALGGRPSAPVITLEHMPDPIDPRTGRARHPRHMPADWVPTPLHVRPASMAPPKDDDALWWRLQPGTPPIVHGGGCADWPPGRAPRGWTYHSRTQVRQLLADGTAVCCPRCQPDLGL